jgi:ATP-dependent RNA helicase SUPV3L1/SUV3
LALQWPPGFAEIIGWVPAGPVLVRLDVAERVASDLGYVTRKAPAPLPPETLGRFGIKGDQLGAVLAGLGFRLIEPAPLGEGVEGPPAPVMVAWARPERGPRPPRRPEGPRREDRRPRPAQAEGAAPPAEGEAPRPARQRREFPKAPRPPRPEAAPGEPRAREDRPQEQRRDGPPRERDRDRGPPRRDDRPRPPRDRDRDRGPAGPETRTFFEDRPAAKAEDSPFAALLKLKLK